MRTGLRFRVMTHFSLVFMQNGFSSFLKDLRDWRVYKTDFSHHFMFRIETSNIAASFSCNASHKGGIKRFSYT